MLSWRAQAPIFLLSVYLLFLLPGDTSARTPLTVAEKCNGGIPIDSSHVTLELFDRPPKKQLRGTSRSSSRNVVPRGTELSCSSRQPLAGPTKVVMHGFGSNGESMKKNGWIQARKSNENLIIVDWSILAKKRNGYKTGASCALEVGKYLAKCLNNLNVDASSLHLFGHSLGAHGVGMAGRELANLGRRRKPSRVTGMDPAGPGFTHSSIVDREIDNLFRTDIIEELETMKIGRDSGDFVDIVHTNIGVYGAEPKLGHVDYYVNGGGPSQPNCRHLTKFDSASHSYAVKVVVASLQDEPQYFRKCDYDLRFKRSNNEPPRKISTLGSPKCLIPKSARFKNSFEVAKTRNGGINTRNGNYFLNTTNTQC